jgi:hypothetical protein
VTATKSLPFEVVTFVSVAAFTGQVIRGHYERY